jgi:hypothetical protein
MPPSLIGVYSRDSLTPVSRNNLRNALHVPLASLDSLFFARPTAHKLLPPPVVGQAGAVSHDAKQTIAFALENYIAPTAHNSDFVSTSHGE